MALDTTTADKGYLLGRLFAVYEQIQMIALGRGINSSVKDRYYASASTQPRKVFAILDKLAAAHLSKIGKRSISYKIWLERLVGSIMDCLPLGSDPFPNALPFDSQAYFTLGYHHQHSEFFKSKKAAQSHEEEAAA